jgi:hypothetical protein
MCAFYRSNISGKGRDMEYRQFLRVIAEKKEGCSLYCNPELSVEDTLYSLIILL